MDGLDLVTWNHDVELALIGTVICHGPAALPHLNGVDGDDFSPANGRLWDASQALASQGVWPDPSLLANQLGDAGIEALGGMAAFKELYLRLQATAPVPSGAGRHVEILRQTARSRRIQAAALELAFNPDNGRVDELVNRLTVLRDDRPNARVRLTPASAVDAGRPSWIWDQRIPIGGVTLMAGREGDGKTLLVCWLAARISRGQLPGQRRDQPADVLYVGLEDDRSTVIKPRLIAAGADPARFHFVDLATDQPFALDSDIADLGHAAHGLDVGLIVFDPLDAHLGHIDSHKKGEVQAAIGRLATLTQDLRCGALGLAHFNKNGLNDLLVRINGSRGFSTAVRSVLAVGAHPDDEQDRLCVLAKANMTSKTDVGAVRFRIEGATITDPTDDTPIATAAVVIVGEEHGHHPDNLLATTNDEERSLTDEATDWLEAILADGPMARAEISALAKHEGITDRPLRTARQRLGVIVERDPTAHGRPATWRLPDQAPEASDVT